MSEAEDLLVVGATLILLGLAQFSVGWRWMEAALVTVSRLPFQFLARLNPRGRTDARTVEAQILQSNRAFLRLSMRWGLSGVLLLLGFSALVRAQT